MVEIIRVIIDGKDSTDIVVKYLSERPMILSSDIIGLIPLAIKFGFVSGDEKKLGITQQGYDFMNYVDATTEKVALISSPMEQDYSTLDKTIKEMAEKYKQTDSEVYEDLLKIRKEVSEKISFAPEIFDDYETLLTVSMPPTFGEKIPLRLKSMIMFHNEAIEKVIQNTSGELLISTYTLDVPTFIQLVTNLNTKRLECRIIIGNADKLLDKKYGYQFSITSLKKFLDTHFSKYEIRLVKKGEGDFISHAKVWLSEKAALITSANITINSHSDNFEAGIYTTRKDLIESCAAMMEKVWDLGEIL